MKFYKYNILKNKINIFLLIIWITTTLFFFYDEIKKKKYDVIFISKLNFKYNDIFNKSYFYKKKYEDYIRKIFINRYQRLYPVDMIHRSMYEPLSEIRESITSKEEHYLWKIKNNQNHCRLEKGNYKTEFLLVSKFENSDFCKKTFMKLMETKFIFMRENFNKYQNEKSQKILEIKKTKNFKNLEFKEYQSLLANNNISDKLILGFHIDKKKNYKDFIENYINNVKIITEDTQEIIKKTEFIIPIFRYKFSIFFLFLPLYIFIFRIIFLNKNKKI